ncbi:hypothetical protein BJ912DRAFT_927048 [Pholiota molesta]|nr:hypothetical protein BJ912DRAFT_927048 [Pholiota molesta]
MSFPYSSQHDTLDIDYVNARHTVVANPYTYLASPARVQDPLTPTQWQHVSTPEPSLPMLQWDAVPSIPSNIVASYPLDNTMFFDSAATSPFGELPVNAQSEGTGEYTAQYTYTLTSNAPWYPAPPPQAMDRRSFQEPEILASAYPWASVESQNTHVPPGGEDETGDMWFTPERRATLQEALKKPHHRSLLPYPRLYSKGFQITPENYAQGGTGSQYQHPVLDGGRPETVEDILPATGSAPYNLSRRYNMAAEIPNDTQMTGYHPHAYREFHNSTICAPTNESSSGRTLSHRTRYIAYASEVEPIPAIILAPNKQPISGPMMSTPSSKRWSTRETVEFYLAARASKTRSSGEVDETRSEVSQSTPSQRTRKADRRQPRLAKNMETQRKRKQRRLSHSRDTANPLSLSVAMSSACPSTRAESVNAMDIHRRPKDAIDDGGSDVSGKPKGNQAETSKPAGMSDRSLRPRNKPGSWSSATHR